MKASAKAGASRAYSKSKSLCAVLSPAIIRKQLAKECGKHAKAHSCLNVFRAHPESLLKWRMMWYALPKADRQERLIGMFSNAIVVAGNPQKQEFSMQYSVLGRVVCRDAFILCTGIHSYTIQHARDAAFATLPMSGLPVAGLPVVGLPTRAWARKRPLLYMDARAWLLDYAKLHGDTSPLNDCILLPSGLKQFYYASYFRDRLARGVPKDQIASIAWFIKVWRDELPWVKIRAPSGPFTHCSICEYLKMLIAATVDATLRSALVVRLGNHYDFQAAQRIAMSNLFRASERDPLEMMAVAWDKMDQQKTIIPRVCSLASTSFFKGGPRIVMSLIGVLAPGLWKHPLLYSVFPDCVHGGNMCASMMLEMLCQIHGQLGCLPRRLVIQADNTQKETKNSICLFAACWLLSHLMYTRLETIEFAYLVVGHTHDLIDAFFSLVNRAAKRQDILSPPHLMRRLADVLSKPPSWKHLQDQYDFQKAQPGILSSKVVKGITQPHHYRVFWGTNGNICVQSKRWLSDPVWSDVVALCTPDDVRDLRSTSLDEVELRWAEDTYPQKFVAWCDKLKSLMHAVGRDTAELDHCCDIVRHKLQMYVNSGESLAEQIRRLQTNKTSEIAASDVDSKLERMYNNTGSRGLFSSIDAYTGAPVASLPLIRSSREIQGAAAFFEEELSDNMFCLYRWSDAGLPIRLGRVLRCVREDKAAAYVVMQSWWPVQKPGKFLRPNIFGTWFKGAKAISMTSGQNKRRRREEASHQLFEDHNGIMVNMEDVLIWPVDVEPGNIVNFGPGSATPEAHRIPFSALRALQARYGINLSAKDYSFSRRGKEFRAFMGDASSSSSSSSSES